MRVADIMTEKPISISLSTTVREAARTLDRLAVRHLPVVNEVGELVGIVSDRDLRGATGGAAASDLLAAAPRASTPIVDVMSTDLVQASADDDLATIMEFMVEQRVGAVPIVDNQGLLVGIVSYVDVLRALLEEMPEASEKPNPRKNHAGKPVGARVAAPAKRKVRRGR